MRSLSFYFYAFGASVVLLLRPAMLFAEPSQELGEIVVSDELTRNQSQDQPSAFVTVIHPKEFEGQFRTTAELLASTVGVRVIDFGGMGQEQSVSIRGSSAEQVVVLLDGVRLNTAQKGAVDIGSIPLEIIERIEITRGGEGSALYGTDAIGGVVNIVTKQGAKTADDKSQTTILGSYGSFTTIKGAITQSGKDGNFDYFLSETHLSSDGDFPYLNNNFQETVRINNKSISEAPFVRFGYDVKDIGRFELSDQFFWAERGQPGFGTTQLATAESDEWRNLVSARFERKKFLVDPLNLNVSTFFRIDQFDFQDPAPQIGPPILSDTRTNAYGGDIKLSYLWAPSHLLSLTTEVRQDDAKVFSQSAAAVNFQNVTAERFTYAFLLRDQMQFFDDVLSILPSVRFENSTDFSGEFIPNLGLRLKTLEWLIFKGNVGRVYRAPNFNELYFPESEFIGGNPFLIPEEGYSADVGFEIRTKPFFFSAAAYRSDVENAIFFVPISATRIEPRNFADHAISQGVEVSGDYEPSQYLSLHAGYTYLDDYFQSTGFLLPGRANHNADFRITGKYKPWVQVYIEGQYISEFAVVLAAAGGQLEPSRFVLNTGVSVTPLEWLTVSLDVKDVNNNQGMNDARDVPLPERSFYGTAQVKF